MVALLPAAPDQPMTAACRARLAAAFRIARLGSPAATRSATVVQRRAYVFRWPRRQARRLAERSPCTAAATGSRRSRAVAISSRTMRRRRWRPARPSVRTMPVPAPMADPPAPGGVAAAFVAPGWSTCRALPPLSPVIAWSREPRCAVGAGVAGQAANQSPDGGKLSVSVLCFRRRC